MVLLAVFEADVWAMYVGMLVYMYVWMYACSDMLEKCKTMVELDVFETDVWAMYVSM